MEREEIEARLMRLGLEEDEARAYVELYLRGPCRAGAIADAMNVHKTKGYWAMETLVRKGFARELASTPTRYEALDPDALAETMQAEARDRIAEIDRIHDRIAEPLEALRVDEIDRAAEDTYRFVHGRSSVRDLLTDAFDRMTDELLVISTGPWAKVTRASYPGLWERAVDLAREAVEVRAVFNTSPEMRRELGDLVEIPTIGARHLGTTRQRPFLVVDRREVLYWLVVDPSTDRDARDEVAVWSNAQTFVRDLEETFRTAWEQAVPLDAPPDAGSRAPSSEPG